MEPDAWDHLALCAALLLLIVCAFGLWLERPRRNRRLSARELARRARP